MAETPSNFKVVPKGQKAVGRTHRRYAFNASGDDFSIKIPEGAEFGAIVDPAENIFVGVGSEAEVMTSSGKYTALDAGKNEPLRPVKVGEYFNISHSDGSTAIGVVYLVLEGNNLPEGAGALYTEDPGA